MAKVTFQPAGKTVEAKVGDNLLKVAIRADVGLKYSCGGAPSCAMCKVVVQEGEELLNQQDLKELDLMGNTYFITKKRLACQTKILNDGDVTLDISEHLEEVPEQANSPFRKPESEWRKCDSERTGDPTRREVRSSKGSHKSSHSNKGSRRPQGGGQQNRRGRGKG